MSEWKEVKLTDVTTKIGDGLHGTPAYNTRGEYFFINGNNLVGGKVLIKADTKRVDFDEYLKHGKPINENTLLLAINGTIGNLALYQNEKCMLGKSACYINVNELIERQFLYYHFANTDFQYYLKQIATGTTIPNVPLKGIREYSFNLPPLPEQRAIAEVLSSLDDKIDLLHRQNTTLEQLAETLFRQWFIEGEGDMDLIPIGDLVDTVDNRGKTPPWTEEQTDYPLIEVNAIRGETRLIDYSVIRKYVSKEVYNSWFRDHPRKYDTLISTVGSIGELGMFLVEKGSIAQNVVAFHPKTISPFYFYQCIKYFQLDIVEFDIGSVQPSIKVSHLVKYEIPVPANALVLEQFHEQVKSYCDKIELNYKQIKTLETLRDTLLPKLMSGEVRVKIG